MHRLAALVLVPLALVLGACGGDETSASGDDSGASIAPATAPLYVSVDADLDSEQWQQLDRHIQRFPGGKSVKAFLDEELRDENLDYERDLEPALGPTLELVILDFEEGGENIVAMTKADDPAKLEAVLKKSDDPAVTREIDGWTVFAESREELDAFARGGDESLADNDRFTEAMDALPDEALAKLYVNGASATKAIAEAVPGFETDEDQRFVAASAALEAPEEGFRLFAFARGEGADPAALTDVGELAGLVPADALAFLNYSGGDGQLKLSSQLREAPGIRDSLSQIETGLGVKLEDLAEIFDDEGVLYVRPGTVIPEVTLVLEVENPANALATFDTLAANAGKLLGQDLELERRRVDGIEARAVAVDPITVFYAAVAGRIVVTTQESGLTAPRGGGAKLIESDRYEAAVDAAGVADGENVLLFLDFDKAQVLVGQLAQLGGDELPAEATRYLEPLRSLVVAGGGEENEGTFRLFVELDEAA